ncbi:outer membrane beta-barrel protein [Vibrio artabrorum]|uniref:outer membrane beta-barrel protein n=1 Tax=Vibrio artabrorum TaxID=446374 RepID=UPI00354D9E20
MKRHTSLASISAVVLLGLVSYTCQAELTPKSHITVAGIDVQSRVGVEYGQDSNVTYQVNPMNEMDSAYTTLTPYLRAVGERGQDRYLLVYSGEYSRYDNASDDDYTDHFLMFQSSLRFGLKHSLNWFIQQDWGHEERGTELTEGFNPTQFNAFGVKTPLQNKFFNSELRYSYGALEGRGKLDFAWQIKDITYDKLDEIQGADSDFYHYVKEQEWQENTLTAELFDQYSSRTRFRYSLISNLRKYETNPAKDSAENYALVGFKSHRTGKLTLEADVAWLYKRFMNNSQAQSFSGLNWDANMNWQPVKHSEWSLYGWRRVKDPTEEGGYILHTKVGVSWKHHWWVERFSTKLDYGREVDDYRIQQNDRKDDLDVASVTLGYDFRPSIRLELNYQFARKRSNSDDVKFFINDSSKRSVKRHLGYDKSTIGLTLKVQI